MPNQGLDPQPDLAATRHLILEMIESGAPLDDVLRAIAAFVDQRNRAGKCCIFLLDPDRGPVQAGAPPASPSDGSSWSSPILSAGSETLGSVTVHFDRPRAPDKIEKDAIGEAARLARIGLERRVPVQRPRAGQDRFRSLIENTPEVIFIL